MKVFITWSGESTKATAVFLRTWLLGVLQELRPWVSAVDIGAGARWSLEIQAALRESAFGIACVTKDNQTAPWLLFETGAIAKGLPTNRVCCYCLGMATGDITVPCLKEFQNVAATEDGTFELLRSLNDVIRDNNADKALPIDVVQRQLSVNWPSLRDFIAGQDYSIVPAKKVEASSTEILRDIQETVREIAREQKRNVPSESLAMSFVSGPPYPEGLDLSVASKGELLLARSYERALAMGNRREAARFLQKIAAWNEAITSQKSKDDGGDSTSTPPT